jgi:hypothetical protein
MFTWAAFHFPIKLQIKALIIISYLVYEDTNLPFSSFSLVVKDMGECSLPISNSFPTIIHSLFINTLYF